MLTTLGAMTVTIAATWSCPSGHHGQTTLTARVSLTPTSLTAHHPMGALPTSCRTCGTRLTDAPALTVPQETQDRLTAWAKRRGLPVVFDWAVAS